MAGIVRALRKKYLAAKSKVALNQLKPQSNLTSAELNEIGQKKTPEAYYVYMDNPIIRFPRSLSIEEKVAIRHVFCMCIASGKTSELESLSEESLATIEYFSSLFPLSHPAQVDFSTFKINEYLKSQHGVLTSAGSLTKYRPHLPRFNALFPNDRLTDVQLTEIMGLTMEEFTPAHYFKVVFLRGLSMASKYKSFHVKYLFILMFSLIYQDHSNITNIRRRWTDLKTDIPELEGDLDPPSQKEITDCWLLVNHNLQLGTDLQVLLDVVTHTVNSLSSDRLSVMMGFVPYSRMTVVKLITDAFIEYNDFPWLEMMGAYPVLKKELNIVMSYLDSIEENTLAGFMIQSIGPQVPNLAYLCVHLHMEIGGKRTLRDYRGVGSTTNPTPVPLRNALEKMIEKFRSSQDTVLACWPESAPQRLDQKITDQMLRFGGGSGGDGGDDDDDGDDLPPHGGDIEPHPDEEHPTDPSGSGPSTTSDSTTSGQVHRRSPARPPPTPTPQEGEDERMATDEHMDEGTDQTETMPSVPEHPETRTTRKTRGTTEHVTDPSQGRTGKQKSKDATSGETKPKKIRKQYRSRDGKTINIDLSNEEHNELVTFLQIELYPNSTEKIAMMDQAFPNGFPEWLQEIITAKNLISTA